MFTGRDLSVHTSFRLIADRVIHHADTTHGKHATEIARDFSLDYDALVTVSGDGLIHEVMNGLAQHARSKEAFSIPIAPVPTGTGNGTSLNLLGMEVSLVLNIANCHPHTEHRMDLMCRRRR